MTEVLTRPLTDNRMLRAVGGPDLAVSLGTAMGAVFETPMMTGLLATEVSRGLADDAAMAGPDVGSYIDQRVSLQQEIMRLEQGVSFVSPGQQRDDVLGQIEALKGQLEDLQANYMSEAVEAGRLRRAEDLQEEYGPLGLTFDRPMSQEEVDILVDEKKAEEVRHALIERGPSGLFPTAAKFGAGLAAMAVDPLEVASSVIPIVGQAGRAAAVARFGRVGGRVAVGTTEGFVGNLLTEPAYFALSRQQQLDYTMNEALLNVGLGAVFGASIGAAAGVVARTGGGRLPEPTPFILAPEMRIDAGGARTVVPVFHNATSRQTADVSLRQFVTDQPVDARPMMNEIPPRPPTRLESGFREGWVLVDRRTSEAVLETRDPARVSALNQDRYIAVPTREYLETFNARVQEAGGQPAPQPWKSADEGGDLPDFYSRNQDTAREWVESLGASTFAEAEQIRLEAIRAELDAMGVRDVSEQDVRDISGAMASGQSLFDAMERVGMNGEGARAKHYARQATSDASSDAADLRASDEAAELSEPALADDVADLEASVEQIELDATELASLNGATEIAEHARAYREAAEAAALCLSRTT